MMRYTHKKYYIITCILFLLSSFTACGLSVDEKDCIDPSTIIDSSTIKNTVYDSPSSVDEQYKKFYIESPNKGELYDLTDDMIQTYDDYLNALEPEDRAEVLSRIPAELRKVIGTIDVRLCYAHPIENEVKQSFQITLYIDGIDEYHLLTDYYKSLDGKIISERDDDTEADLSMKFPHILLEQCLYTHREDLEDKIEIKMKID